MLEKQRDHLGHRGQFRGAALPGQLVEPGRDGPGRAHLGQAGRGQLPGGQVKPVLGELVRLWGQLDALERDHKLDFLREPDVGFAWAAWRWAEGDDLDDVLRVTGLSAGDFVRWMKQLLDLCGQVADAAGDSPLRTTARATAKSLKRGVIAYSVLAE